MLRLPASFTRESLIWSQFCPSSRPGETRDPPPLSAAPPQDHRGCFQRQFHQVGIFRRVPFCPGSKRRGSAANMIGLAMLRRRALAGLTPLVVFIAV